MEHLLAERVKEIMEELGYSPSSFADTIDVPRPIISHILSGRNKPSLDVIQKILMRFSELNPWWLLTGAGTMKQLNLFSDQELEAITIKNEAIQQANHATAQQPVKASPPSAPKAEHKTVEEVIPPVPPAPALSELSKGEQSKASIPAPPLAQALSSGKAIEKMIVFYTDKTFAIYHPE
jgi:transcriptional regulator with XRE-family HTH domain